jgi:hypothetical protein
VRPPIADISRIELVARAVVKCAAAICPASVIGGDRRSSSGSLAKSTRAAMRRASSRVGRFSRRAIDTTQQYVWNLGRSGSARLALETAGSIELALATEAA